MDASKPIRRSERIQKDRLNAVNQIFGAYIHIVWPDDDTTEGARVINSAQDGMCCWSMMVTKYIIASMYVSYTILTSKSSGGKHYGRSNNGVSEALNSANADASCRRLDTFHFRAVSIQ